MAGRRIALFHFFVDGAARLMAATLCASFAFVLWDLVSRNPSEIASALWRGMRAPGTALRAVLRIFIGLIFALLALTLVATVAPRPEFSAVAIAVFLAALGVDALIGDGFRAGIGIRK